MKNSIIFCLTDHAGAKIREIAHSLGLQPSRTRDYLKEPEPGIRK